MLRHHRPIDMKATLLAAPDMFLLGMPDFKSARIIVPNDAEEEPLWQAK
jgi:hypothetical protein